MNAKEKKIRKANKKRSDKFLKNVIAFFSFHLLNSIYCVFFRKNFFLNRFNNILINKSSKIVTYVLEREQKAFGHIIYDFRLLLDFAKKHKYDARICYLDINKKHYLFTIENNLSKVSELNGFSKFIFTIKFLFCKIYFRIRNSFKNKIKWPWYYKRKLLSEEVKFLFPEKDIDEYKKFIDLINKSGKKIVSITSRNVIMPEVQNKSRSDNIRNFDSSYFEKLIKKYNKEFFFIKVGTNNGDNYLDSLDLNNFYNFSAQSNWSQKMETLITFNSYITIHPESGSAMLPRLLGKPLICINLSHPILNFPIHKYEISFMKKVFFDNRQLNINDFLLSDNLKMLRTTSLDYHNITEDDLIEVFDFQKNKLKYIIDKFIVQKSKQIKRKCLKFLPTARENVYFRKWNSNNYYLGDGLFYFKNLIK